MDRHLARLLLPIGLALVVTAQAAVTALPGSSPQTVHNADRFGPVRVLVTEASGAPVPNALVTWTIPYTSYPILAHVSYEHCTAEVGVGEHCSTRTGTDGVAELFPIYSVYGGTHILRVSSERDGYYPLGYADVELNVIPRSPPAVLREWGGSGQTAVKGQQLALPFVARLVNADGTPRVGVEVEFGPGQFSEVFGVFGVSNTATVVTDHEGQAIAPPFRVTRGLGSGRIVARALDDITSTVLDTDFFFSSTDPLGSQALSLQGLYWVGAAEDGWGVSVAQQGTRLFSVVFAYDSAGRATWHALDQGQFVTRYEDYVARVYSPLGSPYYAYDPTRFRPGPPGAPVEMRFHDSDSLTLRIGFALPAFYSKNLQRFEIPYGGASFPFSNLGGTWWAIGGSEPGWAVAMIQRGSNLFALWYTYDANGERTWYSMPAGTWSNTFTYSGTIYRTHGPRWPDYNAGSLVVEPAGTFSFTFFSEVSARFDWSIGARSGSSIITPYVP